MYAVPDRNIRDLCLSTSYADCITTAAITINPKIHFASARPTRIASAKTHKVRLAFMTYGAVSR